MNTPLYLPQNINASAYHLRYAWIGWPSNGLFPKQPTLEFFRTLEPLWETDGIRVLEFDWSAKQIQFTCSVKPTVCPTFFAARMKGRIQHALRVAETPTAFSRKVAFRSIGENRREHVEAYISKQVAKEQFVDDRIEKFMKGFTVSNPDVRLQDPSATERGRYWYNLHVVLVTEYRMRFKDEGSLRQLAETCDKIAVKKSYSISRRSVMPDHVHLSLRGNVEHTPEDIALAFMNNIAFAFGQQAIFRPSYYVGTFGEYDMGAVRS